MKQISDSFVFPIDVALVPSLSRARIGPSFSVPARLCSFAAISPLTTFMMGTAHSFQGQYNEIRKLRELAKGSSAKNNT